MGVYKKNEHRLFKVPTFCPEMVITHKLKCGKFTFKTISGSAYIEIFCRYKQVHLMSPMHSGRNSKNNCRGSKNIKCEK